MKPIPPFLCAILLLAAPIGSLRLYADSAKWNANDGVWSNTANWNPSTTYPGLGTATDQIATFAQTDGLNGLRTVTLDVDATVAGLVVSGSASRAYTITTTTGKKITLASSTDEATVSATGGGGGRILDVEIALDVDRFVLDKIRKLTFQKSLTAAADRDVTVDFSGSMAFSHSTTDITIFQGANDFGAGTINLSSSAGLRLSNAGAAGGSRTTIHFTDTANRTVLDLNTSGTANYGNTVVVDQQALGKIHMLLSGATNVSRMGKISVLESGSLEVTSWVNGYFSTASQVYLAEGALLLAQGDRSHNSAAMTMTLASGASLTGVGTIATAANGISVNNAIKMEAGTVFAPGDPATLGATGLFYIGSETYGESKLTLLGGATIRFDLAGLQAGDEHDQIRVVGSSALSISGANAQFNLLTLDYAYEDEVVLIRFDADATRTGMFAGLAEGALVSFGTLGSAEISYLGGDGNDIALIHFQLIPEPGTFGLLAAGLIAAGYYRRRKK